MHHFPKFSQRVYAPNTPSMRACSYNNNNNV